MIQRSSGIGTPLDEQLKEHGRVHLDVSLKLTDSETLT